MQLCPINSEFCHSRKASKINFHLDNIETSCRLTCGVVLTMGCARLCRESLLMMGAARYNLGARRPPKGLAASAGPSSCGAPSSIGSWNKWGDVIAPLLDVFSSHPSYVAFPRARPPSPRAPLPPSRCRGQSEIDLSGGKGGFHRAPLRFACGRRNLRLAARGQFPSSPAREPFFLSRGATARARPPPLRGCLPRRGRGACIRSAPA